MSSLDEPPKPLLEEPQPLEEKDATLEDCDKEEESNTSPDGANFSRTSSYDSTYYDYPELYATSVRESSSFQYQSEWEHVLAQNDTPSIEPTVQESMNYVFGEVWKSIAQYDSNIQTISELSAHTQRQWRTVQRFCSVWYHLYGEENGKPFFQRMEQCVASSTLSMDLRQLLFEDLKRFQHFLREENKKARKEEDKK